MKKKGENYGKVKHKDEVAILNQGWFTDGAVLIRTDRIDFTDEKLQVAKKRKQTLCS